MGVVEVNRHFKPGKSRFGRHSRKRKTPLSRSGYPDGQKSRTVWNYDMHGRLAQIDDLGNPVKKMAEEKTFNVKMVTSPSE